MSLDSVKIFLSLLLFAFAINASAATAGTKIKIPCSQLKAPPYYTQFLVPTPKASSGWKCTAFVEKGTLRDMKAYQWTKKGQPTILLTGVPMEFMTPLPKDMKALIDDPKEPQPKLSIRNFINVFSADQKYMTNDARTALVNQYLGNPKALFFSRGNAIVAAYYDDMAVMSDDLPLVKAQDQNQRLVLFQDSPGHADMFLAVDCNKCFFDDLFKLVITPMMNAPVPEIVFPKSGK